MIRVSPFVIDASALLAFLRREPGAERVGAVLSGATISAVNWSEVVQKSIAHGLDHAGRRADLEVIGLRVEPFLAEDAEAAASLWIRTKDVGLSLADRACLALSQRLDATALTADRAWLRLRAGIRIESIR